jgi:hypothetical protein
MKYEFSLAQTGEKFTCPECLQKSFVPYIHNDGTGKWIAPEVGRCDRLDKCGYHLPPSKYRLLQSFPPLEKEVAAEYGIEITETKDADYSIDQDMKPQIGQRVPSHGDCSYISADCKKRFLKGQVRDANAFSGFLNALLGAEATANLLIQYRVDLLNSSGVVFWQIDTQGKIRTGKVMHYKEDGHRKRGEYSIKWVHKLMGIKDFKLEQCLFGEHLLGMKYYDNKVVCIVESEKTALIASTQKPLSSYVWLATGGKENFKLIERCEALKGRQIVLFPDLGATDNWKKKADEIKVKLRLDISVSEDLETVATDAEREAGWDIADFILRIIMRRNFLRDILRLPEFSESIKN